MGEPLSPDHVFDFPMDELEPHPAYDFFMPGLLPRYAGNPKNNNGWIEADVPLLKELGAMADELMVSPLHDEIAEPIVKAEEQVIAPLIDMNEDITMLFGDCDFSDDNSKGFEDKEEVWEVNEEWLMALVTPPPMLVVHAPSIYEVGGPSTAAVEGLSFPFLAAGLPVLLLVIEYVSARLGNLEYKRRQLVKKVIQVSDAEVADGNGQIGAGWCSGGAGSVDWDPKRRGDYRIGPGGAGVTSFHATKRFADSVVADYARKGVNPILTLRRDLLENIKFLRWVEAKVVSSEVESEKWSRLLLHQKNVAIDVATDGRKGDLFPQNRKQW
nr:hypothetical protein [Tanacetum cinerariifolium]